MSDTILINKTDAKIKASLEKAIDVFSDSNNGTKTFTASKFVTTDSTNTMTAITGYETSTPQMDGTGSAGTSDTVSRGDHIHPTDSAKADVANPVFIGTVTTPIVKITPEGGIAVKMTNKNGSVVAKGYIVEAYSTTSGFRVAPIDAWSPIGVVYDTSIENDAEGWVVVSGIAEVYYRASSTIGHLARVGVGADTGEVAGQAESDGSPANDAVHFREIGHPIQTRVDAGLALTILHFN